LKNAPIRIYGNEQVISEIRSRMRRRALPLDLHQAKPFVPIEADHLTFTPIEASHAAGEICFNYVIQSGDSTVLHASDTGPYATRTIGFLSELKLDAIIIECTRGASVLTSSTHMSLRDILRLRAKLQRTGAVHADTRIILTHLSHNIGLTHEELERLASRKGLEVAYDGMIIEV
jgi:phosphoribosyl 1,2-cyclic phosphate phosphodiesterase